MNALSVFNLLLCPQLFGDVCYTCSHVIEGDGEHHPPAPTPSPPIPGPTSCPSPCPLRPLGLCALQLCAQLALPVLREPCG